MPIDSAYAQLVQAASQQQAASRLHKLLRRPAWMATTYGVQALLKMTRTTRAVKATTFWGGEMTVLLPEAVSTLIHRYGVYEPGVTTFLLETLKPGMTFLDIGAHFGYFSLLAADLVGAVGQVHSFEPARRTFAVLSRNAGNRTNIVINNVAAFSRSGTIEFNDLGPVFSAFNSIYGPRLETDCARHSQYMVPTICVDEYVANHGLHPSFIKIDAESAEAEIWRGMKATLKTHSPAVSIEVGDMNVNGAATTEELLRLASQDGYEAFEYHEGETIKCRARDSHAFNNLLLKPAY